VDTLNLVTTRNGAVRFEVRAHPRARKNGVAGIRNGALMVRLTAAPVEGAANTELVATLAAALAIAKRDVELVRGDGAREKLIEVRGLSAEEVRSRLRGAAGEY
jgi:uncharacterized protein